MPMIREGLNTQHLPQDKAAEDVKEGCGGERSVGAVMRDGERM